MNTFLTFVAMILKLSLHTKLQFFHISKHCVSKEVGSLYFIEEKLTQAEQQHMSLLIWGLHFATFFWRLRHNFVFCVYVQMLLAQPLGLKLEDW